MTSPIDIPPFFDPSAWRGITAQSGMVAFEVAQLPESSLHNIILPTGGRLATRRYPRQGVYWVALKGAGVVILAGTRHPVEQPQVVFVPAEKSFALHNTGIGDLHLLEIRNGCGKSGHDQCQMQAAQRQA